MKKENAHVVYCPPCGESTLKGGKGVVNKETLMDNPPSALRATSPAGGEVNGAFTLIELLVVVLIIGILAAIAVPQYQLAVLKAKVGTFLPLMQSIASAEEVYYLQNEKYATDAATLDINMPGSCTPLQSNMLRHFSCDKDLTFELDSSGAINLNYCPGYGTDRSSCIEHLEANIHWRLQHYPSGTLKKCYVYNNSKIGKKLCKSLEGFSCSGCNN